MITVELGDLAIDSRNHRSGGAGVGVFGVMDAVSGRPIGWGERGVGIGTEHFADWGSVQTHAAYSIIVRTK